MNPEKKDGAFITEYSRINPTPSKSVEKEFLEMTSFKKAEAV